MHNRVTHGKTQEKKTKCDIKGLERIPAWGHVTDSRFLNILDILHFGVESPTVCKTQDNKKGALVFQCLSQLYICFEITE